MVIGFDFDKVFINYPPFVPYFLVDFLYKGRSVFENKPTRTTNLHYRFPGYYEQLLRILTHHPILRNPITENINYLKKITKLKKNKTYLVSSRYSFLRDRTEKIIDKYSLEKYFDGIYFNYENIQPHIFKEKTIKKLRIEVYIDDDLHLAMYLARKIPSLKIFWVNDGNDTRVKMPNSITAIRNLEELEKYLDFDE